jgi:poly(3-hydroxyalkanoate) synthetase
MQQFPPGPWTSDEDPQICEIWDANENLVAEVNEFVRNRRGDRQPNRTDEEVLAIGQAIAAVPKLIEALILIRNDVAQYPAFDRPCHALDVVDEALKLAGIEP